MKTKLTLIIMMCALVQQLTAQTTEHKLLKWKHYVHAGVNLGATAPLSLPNTIRKIEQFSPRFSPAAGYEVVYSFNEHWGLGTGLRLEYKGMSTRDSVAYFHTIVSMDDAEFEGDFTGTNRTHIHNGYVTVPLHAVFTPGSKWRYKAGLYFSRLIDRRFNGDVSNGYIRKGDSMGEKVEVERAVFDFANVQRSFDWGVLGGAERKFGDRLGVNATLDWGLRPLFPSSFKGMSFKMYNIYLTVGASFRL